MSCQFCDYPINAIVTFHDHSVTCMHCGSVFYREATKTVYRGFSKDDKRIHLFQVMHPYYCPECNWKISVFEIPCGGNFYFQFEECKERAERY